MKRRTFVKIAGAMTAQAGVLVARDSGGQTGVTAPAMVSANPFLQQGRWYKAALHVHTTTSDGDVDVATRLAEYRAAGYEVVAVTDHWKTNDLSRCSDDGFLAISGMEAHPDTGTGAPKHHFVCLNLPHPFELAQDLPAQTLIDKVIEVGGQVIYAHPYWSAHTLEEMTEVRGYVGMEVFNGVCHLRWRKGHGSVHWDQLLNKGRLLPAMATDDVHKTSEIDQGWTMIKAPSLDPAAIMHAIASGCYYSSCGPVIEDCRIEADAIGITTSPVKKISFFFDGAAGGRIVQAAAGETITHANWRFGGDKRRYRWIRAEVEDPDGHFAWINPMAVDAPPSTQGKSQGT